MKTLKAEIVLNCQNQHGEGVFWNPQDNCIWWTDINGYQLWQYNPITGLNKSRTMPDRVCCFAPRRSGGFIVAFAQSVVLHDNIDATEGEWTTICEFEAHNVNTRTNDGRTDRMGRFIVGGMNEVTAEYDSSVICIDKNLKVKTLIEGVSCANSICFSPDGETFYFADTLENNIQTYDYDQKMATISNRRVLTSFENEPGIPDGSCVDSEGYIWNAEWNGHRVVRISPNGKLDTIVEVPVLNPTCCSFGGPNLDTLYITTSRLMMDDEMLHREPNSGGLFAVKPGVKGISDKPFLD